MAEGLWNSLAAGRWQAFSAGSNPAGFVHPRAIQVMREVGIDISANRSKSSDEFAGQHFDLVVTVCDNAQQVCPTFPGARDVMHWPFEDPAFAAGSQEERLVVFRRVRDEIRDAIQRFLQSQT